MAFSVQLLLMLILIVSFIFFYLIKRNRSALFAVIFVTLLFFPVDAMGLISGTSYSTAGKFNISLTGYAVLILFVMIVAMNRGKLKIRERNTFILMVAALMLLLVIRLIVDGADAVSNKLLDGYFLPAVLAMLIMGYVEKKDVPVVLKKIYVCIFINAVVACIEIVLGQSLFFHNYYLSTVPWYEGIYGATYWGVAFRTSAFLGHPLVGGTYYLLAWVYFLNSRNKGKWYAAGMQMIVLIVAMYSTNSRGVFLCAIGYTVYFLLKEKKYIKFGTMLFACIFALSFLDLEAIYAMVFSRDTSGLSISVRMRALASVSAIPLDILLGGTGYNNTKPLMTLLGFTGNFEISYLIVLVENGLIGFVAWVISIVALYRKRMEEKVKNTLNGMIICFLAIAATSNSFGDPGTLTYMLWALFAFSNISGVDVNEKYDSLQIVL